MLTQVLRLIGTAVVALTALAQVARAEFIQVDPQGGYLRSTNDEYDLHAPLIVDLQARGYDPGEVLHLKVVGHYALSMFPDSDPTNSVDAFDYLGAVFSSSNALGAAGQLNRVAGAIATTRPAMVTNPTLFGGLPTDIAEDFRIHDILVQIPVGALYLFVAVPDIFYSDNRDPFDPGNRLAVADFGVEISIPEPAPAAIMAMLTTGLMLRRRQVPHVK